MAIIRWIGGAVAVADVWTITVAGTWATNDTVTITVGNKDLVISLGVGASTTVANIATEIKNAIMAADNSSPGTGYTWSHGGQQFREFTEFEAEVNGAVVTVTGLTAGTPLFLEVTEVTAGSGTATESNTVPATGPNHLDNADNYLGGELPVDNDVLYFDTGDVSVLYGLTYFRGNDIDLDVYVTGDWTGALGLPPVRTVAAGDYGEFRQRYFQVRGGSKVFQVLPGVNGSTGQGALYLDLQDQNACTVSILSRRGLSSGVPTVFLCGSTAGTNLNVLTITQGTVSIEPDDAPTDASKYFRPSNIIVGSSNSALTDCIVYIGKNARLHLGVLMQIMGGTVITYAPTKISTDTFPCTLLGGSLELAGAGDEAELTAAFGSAIYPTGPSGAIEKAFIRGTLDYRRGSSTKSGLDVKLYANASLYDPGGSVVPSLCGCTPSQLAAFVIPADRIINYATAADPT